jgi:hypothetical protein
MRHLSLQAPSFFVIVYISICMFLSYDGRVSLTTVFISEKNKKQKNKGRALKFILKLNVQ